MHNQYHSLLTQTSKEKMALTQKHQDLISQQDALFSRGAQYCSSIDVFDNQVKKLKQENHMIANALVGFQSGKINSKLLNFLFHQNKLSNDGTSDIYYDSDSSSDSANDNSPGV